MSKTYSFSAGTTIESAKVNQNFDELGLLAQAQVTADQGTFTAETDLTSLTVTVVISAAFAAAGRKIKITGQCDFSSSVASDAATLRIKEGATNLKYGKVGLSATANRIETATAIIYLTPAAGSHTYKLAGVREAGTGNITMKAAADNPAFISVEAV